LTTTDYVAGQDVLTMEDPHTRTLLRELPEPAPETELRLLDVPLREVVELVRIDLPSDELEPLLERGILPGCLLCPLRYSPSGDPIVRVDGSLLALRRETAGCLCVRRGVLPVH